VLRVAADLDAAVCAANTLSSVLATCAKLARGSHYLCAAVAGRVAGSIRREDLTHRETEVLDLLTLGMANKVIARELGIAVGTVKTHVKGIF
jgi:DNA-binding NarL/FixJ family response regulator